VVVAAIGTRFDSDSDNSFGPVASPRAGSLVFMPLIFNLVCSKCGFADKVHSTAYAVVDTEDGREEICPHPVERLTARRITGVEWPELVRAKRVGYRYALTCQACSKTDYYRRARGFRGPAQGLIAGIAHVPSPEDAREFICLSCGRPALVPSTRVGRGWQKQEVPCPNCAAPLELAVKGLS
jgi:hypothetical protein